MERKDNLLEIIGILFCEREELNNRERMRARMKYRIFC